MLKRTLIIGDHIITMSETFKVRVIMKAKNGTKLKMACSYETLEDARKAFDSWGKTLDVKQPFDAWDKGPEEGGGE